MIVNQIAKAAGVEPHVVRYYTRIGLLRPRRDPENGYQHFSEIEFQRLQIALRLRHIGLTLNDIAALLDDHSRDTPEWQKKVRATLLRRMEDNRKQLRQLITLQNRMEQAYERGADIAVPPATEKSEKFPDSALDLCAPHRSYSLSQGSNANVTSLDCSKARRMNQPQSKRRGRHGTE